MQKQKISYDQIINDLKKKIYHPVYILTGNEPYYIDEITKFAAENILTPEERSFNQTIFYGKDVDAAEVTNTAKRYPMMANHQLVIVKEAQEMKNFEDLVHYIQKPLNSTILILNYKYENLDKRKKKIKSLFEKALVFDSQKLYDYKIPQWVVNWLKAKDYNIEARAANLLTEFLGNDLSRIANELEKLISLLPPGMKIITADHIEKNIGLSKDYNNFELQKAIIKKDPLKANMIIRYFAINQKNHHISQTIVHFYFFFARILKYHKLKDHSEKNAAAALGVHPFFISEYREAARIYSLQKTAKCISILREYDLKSKGYGNRGASAGDLLKELTYKLIH